MATDQEEAQVSQTSLQRAEALVNTLKKLEDGFGDVGDFPEAYLPQAELALQKGLNELTRQVADRVRSAVVSRRLRPEEVSLVFLDEHTAQDLVVYGRAVSAVQTVRQDLEHLWSRLIELGSDGAPSAATLSANAVGPALNQLGNVALQLAPVVLAALQREKQYSVYRSTFEPELVRRELIDAFKDNVASAAYTVYDTSRARPPASEHRLQQQVNALETDLERLELQRALDDEHPLAKRLNGFLSLAKSVFRDLRSDGGRFPRLDALRDEDALAQLLSREQTFVLGHSLHLSSAEVVTEARWLGRKKAHVTAYLTLSYDLLDVQGRVVRSEAVYHEAQTPLE